MKGVFFLLPVIGVLILKWTLPLERKCHLLRKGKFYELLQSGLFRIPWVVRWKLDRTTLYACYEVQRVHLYTNT